VVVAPLKQTLGTRQYCRTQLQSSGVTDQPFDGQFGGPACVLPAHRHKSSVPDDLDPADLARIITISHQIIASKF